MNENGGFADPNLVSELQRSVALPSPDRTLVRRANLLLSLTVACAELDVPAELARNVCARMFAAEDAGEPVPFELALGEAIEHRWHHAEICRGWEHFTFSRALRIFAACFTAWTKETT